MGEFDLIGRYFDRQQSADTVQLALGDDCAVVSCPLGKQIAITTDTMVEGTHFLPNIPPEALAHKALASNLSDLASMGAVPQWISLALTLPKMNEDWLQAFSDTLFSEMEKYQLVLIGGDTTKGEKLTVTITAQGFLPQGKALQRHLGEAGDYIFVSGTLGDSAAGLKELLNNQELTPKFYQRHFFPTPRVTLGRYLLENGFSICAVDISDGFCADLGHIAERSGTKAVIEIEKLPLSYELLKAYSFDEAIKFALTGGEDYELCFTVKSEKIADFRGRLKKGEVPCAVSEVGRLKALEKNEKSSVQLRYRGKNFQLLTLGFDHFKEGK